MLLFSNQARFVGYIARAVPQLGDITFFVGFLLAGGQLPAAVPIEDRRRTRRGVTIRQQMLDVAVDEARKGLAEGGIPIGAALFAADGTLLGSGHNRRVQQDDPSVHAETDAFRAAGRQRDYRSTVMVTTLSPCWYCSGLVRQFNIGAVVIGEATHVPRRARLAGRTRGRRHGSGRRTLCDDDDGVHRGQPRTLGGGHR